MNIIFTYPELNAILAKAIKVKIELSRVDNKTVAISYSPGWMIPQVSINVHIDGIRRDIICLTYDCNAAISLIVMGAVEHLRSKLPRGIEIDTNKKTINIFPQSLDKLASWTKHFTITNIVFNPESVEVTTLINDVNDSLDK